jgi:putative DNA primase/helicase
VAARFGLAAAAGELATGLGILPWSRGGATVAAGGCFRAWLDARGGSGAAEIADGIRQVQAFISVHGSSRFERWGESAETSQSSTAQRTINRAGWRRKDLEGRWEYLVTTDGFHEMTAGFDRRTLVRALIERGLLLPDDEGKSSRSMTVPEHGKLRLYHFPADALGGGSGDA